MMEPNDWHLLEATVPVLAQSNALDPVGLQAPLIIA
jgi:hypothetical protein